MDKGYIATFTGGFVLGGLTALCYNYIKERYQYVNETSSNDELLKQAEEALN